MVCNNEPDKNKHGVLYADKSDGGLVDMEVQNHAPKKAWIKRIITEDSQTRWKSLEKHLAQQLTDSRRQYA